MLRTLALFYAGLSFVGSLLIFEPKQSTSAAVKSSVDSAAGVATVSQPGLAITEALKTPQFWLLWIMIIFSATTGSVKTVFALTVLYK